MNLEYFQGLAAKHHRGDSVIEYTGFPQLQEGTVLRLICQGNPDDRGSWIAAWGGLTMTEQRQLKTLKRKYPVGCTACHGALRVRGYIYRPNSTRKIKKWDISVEQL